MRPPRIHFQNTSSSAVIAVMFVMVFAWTVILASAQDQRPQKAVKKGTIHTVNKLVVQKNGHNMVSLSGNWYKITGSTEFLSESGQRIPRNPIQAGSLVNVVYVTDKDRTENYPFSTKDRVLLKIQIIAAASK